MVDWGDVLKFLGSTTAVVAVLGFVAQNIFKHFLTQDIEKYKAQLKGATEVALLARKAQLEQQMEAFKTELAARTARTDRIRQEVIRWANPILGAVIELERRLKNILSDEGNLALSPNAIDTINRNGRSLMSTFFPARSICFPNIFVGSGCWKRS